MIGVLFAKTKTEAEKTMNKLMKSGEISSYEPTDIIRNTDDEKTAVCPANRVYMHTEFVDYFIQDGKMHILRNPRYRDGYIDAVRENLKEFAYEMVVKVANE